MLDWILHHLGYLVQQGGELLLAAWQTCTDEWQNLHNLPAWTTGAS
jgi:hypothetical protein